ncbi:MAG TPA: cytochrome ubiquinol oxidase subunit I [bacterium]|nr:cytochrome ubiquinol oxidase subunit I [bacterium]
MDIFQSPEFLSRLQFAFLAMFHILWPPLTVGLAIIILGLETTWLKTKNIFYYHQTRFWIRIFMINFGVGVISGIPMEFAFGTNWGPFSIASGDFFGNILGFETAMAFMLEAGFLGIMLFGWNRVSGGMHLFATSMVVLGSTLSVFWIMVANSWMQTPSGVEYINGKFIITDYLAAVFNPDLAHGFWHMFIACIELSLVVVAGISAYYLLKQREIDFFLPSFKIAVLALVFITPLQILIGDSAGGALAHTQPAKLAAIESHWETNPPGKGASWAVLAIPDAENQRNLWELTIPNALSLIVTHSLTGTVVGLREFKPEDQPPIWIPFYAFRLMLAAGIFIAFMAMWTAWLLWRKKQQMSHENISQNTWLLRGWILAIPAAYLAVEMGWLVREIGRQPWIVYGMMRTQHGVSELPLATVQWSLLSFFVFYLAIGIAAFYFIRHVLRQGPAYEAAPKSIKNKDRPMSSMNDGGY